MILLGNGLGGLLHDDVEGGAYHAERLLQRDRAGQCCWRHGEDLAGGDGGVRELNGVDEHRHAETGDSSNLLAGRLSQGAVPRVRGADAVQSVLDDGLLGLTQSCDRGCTEVLHA